MERWSGANEYPPNTPLLQYPNSPSFPSPVAPLPDWKNDQSWSDPMLSKRLSFARAAKSRQEIVVSEQPSASAACA